MDESEAQTQVVGNSGGTLCTAGVRTDNDCILEPGNLSFNISLQQWLAIKIVDGNVKESLVSFDDPTSAMVIGQMEYDQRMVLDACLQSPLENDGKKELHTVDRANPS